MQSTEKINKKKKIVNYERAPGICDKAEGDAYSGSKSSCY